MDHRLQTDVILLDFQKVFDTVLLQRLLSKLSCILEYSKSNIFLDKLLAHSWSEEATSNYWWFNFCMDSSKIFLVYHRKCCQDHGHWCSTSILIIMGKKYHPFCGFLPMIIVYFIQLSHSWRTPYNYSVSLIAFYNGHSYDNFLWTSISENVLLYSNIEQIPLSK